MLAVFTKSPRRFHDGPSTQAKPLHRKNQRKQKLIRNDVQLKVVFITLFVASLVLLINFQLSFAALWSLQSEITANTSVTLMLETIRRSLVSKFLVTVAVAIPLAAAVGILYSFKFSGPIHRFKLHFQNLWTGRWDQPCRLRTGDDLVDVCDALNSAVDAVNEVVVRNDAVLRSLQALGRDGTLSSSDDAKLQDLLAQADQAVAGNQERIPSLVAAGDSASSQEAMSAEAVVETTV
jgi:hypothetical protein